MARNFFDAQHCERCNGLLPGYDDRVYVIVFYGGVKARVCHACANDINKVVLSHPRWPDVVTCERQPAEETPTGIAERVREELELLRLFHDFVRGLLPYQRTAAAQGSGPEPAAATAAAAAGGS